MNDATQRFSSRVENYIRYRPTYPHAVIDCLKAECQLTPHSTVADVGSGTGILSEMFLQNGNTVYGIEPNREMREAGERLLHRYTNFKSTAARAEATTLEEASIDFVTAGQAFHWFDRDAAKEEFKHILKPHGWVILVWNQRRLASTPFLRDYERLLQTYGTDYQQVDHTNIDDAVLADFFSPHGFKSKSFVNRQILDHEGIEGRLLSSSYVPDASHPHYSAMLHELSRIFQIHQSHGTISLDYDTNLYYGQMHQER